MLGSVTGGISCTNALVWRAREFSRAATYHSRGLAAFIRSSSTETKQSRSKSRQPRKCYISGVVGATSRMAHIHCLLFSLFFYSEYCYLWVFPTFSVYSKLFRFYSRFLNLQARHNLHCNSFLLRSTFSLDLYNTCNLLKVCYLN